MRASERGAGPCQLQAPERLCRVVDSLRARSASCGVARPAQGLQLDACAPRAPRELRRGRSGVPGGGTRAGKPRGVRSSLYAALARARARARAEGGARSLAQPGRKDSMRDRALHRSGSASSDAGRAASASRRGGGATPRPSHERGAGTRPGAPWEAWACWGVEAGMSPSGGERSCVGSPGGEAEGRFDGGGRAARGAPAWAEWAERVWGPCSLA